MFGSDGARPAAKWGKGGAGGGEQAGGFVPVADMPKPRTATLMGWWDDMVVSDER